MLTLAELNIDDKDTLNAANREHVAHRPRVPPPNVTWIPSSSESARTGTALEGRPVRATLGYCRSSRGLGDGDAQSRFECGEPLGELEEWPRREDEKESKDRETPEGPASWRVSDSSGR